MSCIGVVVIGRNEGGRLRDCLTSVIGHASSIVYVDSGSSDDSVAMAKQLGVHVVELDLSSPFTAARARNEGFARLTGIDPDIEFVQFVDGDCEVNAQWIETSSQFLIEHSDVAIACGRRRERNADASIYNRLCDIEWNTPVGETLECGGDAMIRASAFRVVGGYDPAVIAGEEPEMCARLRQRGWKVFRLDVEMTLHDAAITRFGQWWRRSLRAGYAQALAATLYGDIPEVPAVRRVRSAWFWGLLLPMVSIVFAAPTRGLSMLLPGGYLLLAFRIYLKTKHRIARNSDRRLYAAACVLAKFPEMVGQLKFLLSRLSGKRSAIIEYKHIRTA